MLVLVLVPERGLARVLEMAQGPGPVRGQVPALVPEMALATGLVQAPEMVPAQAQEPVKACPTPEGAPVRRCFHHLPRHRRSARQ